MIEIGARHCNATDGTTMKWLLASDRGKGKKEPRVVQGSVLSSRENVLAAIILII